FPAANAVLSRFSKISFDWNTSNAYFILIYPSFRSVVQAGRNSDDFTIMTGVGCAFRHLGKSFSFFTP
ncbi:MAG: hypothetical protein J2P31_05665, partial [Blastocatellia bacterium]|nr:hypothetical protein [Blastocatellia bacterium]